VIIHRTKRRANKKREARWIRERGLKDGSGSLIV
jgi:hypothetical protein